MGIITFSTMAFVPYAAGYGHPGQYGYPGAFGAYGPSLEEVKKIREAEEKAFEDAVTKEKEFYEKERELVKKLGGYPYAFGGSHGYCYPGQAGAGYAGAYGAGAYGAHPGYGHGAYGARAGYGYPYRF